MLPPEKGKRFRKNWISDTEIFCSKCKTVKNIDEFGKSKSRSTGIQYYCKLCMYIYKRENNLKNFELYREYRRRNKYGLEIGEYDKFLQKQNFKCAICNLEKKLIIDHCHKTGRVRGLLCQTCNSALGKVKDNIEILASAIMYLGTV